MILFEKLMPFSVSQMLIVSNELCWHYEGLESERGEKYDKNMIKGVYDGSIGFIGYNQWISGDIDERDDDHRNSIKKLIIKSCKNQGIDICPVESCFHSKDGLVMSKEWLRKYAYGFLVEIDRCQNPDFYNDCER